MYFDIDKIVLEFHGSFDKSKFEDIVQIVEERKEWSDVVRSMFKEKNYIPID